MPIFTWALHQQQMVFYQSNDYWALCKKLLRKKETVNLVIPKTFFAI